MEHEFEVFDLLRQELANDLLRYVCFPLVKGLLNLLQVLLSWQSLHHLVENELYLLIELQEYLLEYSLVDTLDCDFKLFLQLCHALYG